MGPEREVIGRRGFSNHAYGSGELEESPLQRLEPMTIVLIAWQVLNDIHNRWQLPLERNFSQTRSISKSAQNFDGLFNQQCP